MPSNSQWLVADVAALPCPHNPFRCKWKREFKQALSEESDNAAGRRRAFERFANALGPRIEQCRFHRPDWVRVAETGVALINAGKAPKDGVLDTALAELGPEEQWALESLYFHAIWINGPELGNGQHRVCAMKLAGVERCPIKR
jgi:hypothetical protein